MNIELKIEKALDDCLHKTTLAAGKGAGILFNSAENLVRVLVEIKQLKAARKNI